MKLSVVNALALILAGIKINRITDKEVKTALVNDYLHLRRFAKKAEEDRDEIVRKFREDWKDELPVIEAYRREGKPIAGQEDYLEAEKDANKAIADLFSAEVDTEVKSVPMDVFLGACGGEELNLEQIALLQENGIIG